MCGIAAVVDISERAGRAGLLGLKDGAATTSATFRAWAPARQMTGNGAILARITTRPAL
jgi:hypothetical protein